MHAWVKNLVARFSHRFCPVHGYVCIPQQVIGLLIISRTQRDANVVGYGYGESAENVSQGQLFLDSCRNPRYIGRGCNVIQKDGKLITAEQSDRISGV